MTDQAQKKMRAKRLWPDVGKELGLSKNSTYEAAKRGEIPTIRIGRRLLVPDTAYERMLAGGAA